MLFKLLKYLVYIVIEVVVLKSGLKSQALNFFGQQTTVGERQSTVEMV